MKSVDKNSSRIRFLLIPIAAAILFLAGIFKLGSVTSAQAGGNTLFVAPGGSGISCAQTTPCTLDEALTQAMDEDIVYVAQGTYTGTGTAVAQLLSSVYLYGGWDGSPASGPVVDPVAYPTTLDGEDQRQVVRLMSHISPTIDGFWIINGRESSGAGIGAFANTAPVIRNNVIMHNVAIGSWGVASK